MEKQNISLSELNKKIKGIIQDNFFENTWIIAEIGEIKFNRNGHAYLELIEKDLNSDKIIAKASANIWSYTLRMLKPYFETTTGQELQAGLKIMVAVSVEFHELYGFSLNIRDIDPTYTLGDIERRRLEIIHRLEEEGVLEMNKELELPLVSQKIAIISSSTAAGYEDFIKQLEKNDYGFKFYTKLFPATMQGEKTEDSIIQALVRIYGYEDFFDLVVIIRGGGSRSDLMSFDNYNLAYYITQFPIPIIAGIGHEKDVSIVDMVCHTSVKTPTAVAEFLISELVDFEQQVDEYAETLNNFTEHVLDSENEHINTLSNRLVPLLQNRLSKETKHIELAGQKISLLSKSNISEFKQSLSQYQSGIVNICHVNIKILAKDLNRAIEKIEYRVKQNIFRQHKTLEYFENSARHFDPINVLKKGYSITKLNGKILLDASETSVNDTVETILYKGQLKSKVE
ncbi:MAG: exodeoxyribonuclease VII large subunit [Bacteroidales bacterium]|nr:exodeoxyribonuclease VII large subunit [Bacteroidales bacterium]